MARRRGTVTAKSPGKWLIRFYIGTDPETRKRRYHSEQFKGSERAAYRRLDAALAEHDQGALATGTGMRQTLSAYLTEWLDDKEGEVEARTAHDYRGMFRRYIQQPPKDYPPIGLTPLGKLRPKSFTTLFRHMAETRGLSHRTVMYLRTILGQALGDAVAEHRIANNPVQYSKVWKRRVEPGADGRRKPRVKAMNGEQAGRFLEASKECRYHALWAVLLYGGLRPEEAYALKWSDTDLDSDGSLSIVRALVRVGVDREKHPEGWALRPVKRDASVREVALPLPALAALRKWETEQKRERMAAGAVWTDRGFVFTNATGGPMDHRTIGRWHFRRVMQRAKLGEYGEAPAKPDGQPGPGKARPFRHAFPVYALRHTHATLALADGEDIHVVSRRLGHASIEITYNHYGHVLPDRDRAAAARFERLLGG